MLGLRLSPTAAISTVVILSMGISNATDPASHETEHPDHQALQGKWEVVKAEEAGGNPVGQAIGLVYTFEGRRLNLQTPRPVVMKAEFKIDPEKEPRQLTYTILDEIGEPVVNQAIYRIEGDTLTLCGSWNSRPGVRKAFPKKFKAVAGDLLSYLMVLKRIDDNEREKASDGSPKAP